MTTALTPDLALAYLDELTVDVRAAVVLGADGEALAGDEALASRARELLASPADHPAPAPGVLGMPVTNGTLLLARAEEGAAIALLAGPCALLSLLGHDLARVAQALEATGRPGD